MIYEVRARILFIVEDEAKDFYHDCEVAFAKGTTILADEEAAEYSITEFIENHHEDNPRQPCRLLKSLSNKPL